MSGQELAANSLTKIGEFCGECLLNINGESLTVKEPQGAKQIIAKWQHSYVRKFRTETKENLFIFESGRQGPFGVSEYTFKMTYEDLLSLQYLLTEFTGAFFKCNRSSTFMEEHLQRESSPVASPRLRISSFTTPSSNSINFLASLDQLQETPAVQAEKDYMDEETDENVKKKRRQIFKELVETEQVYINDLKIVINAYYDSMDPDNMSIPLRLRGKRDIVFGNLQDIIKFHDSVFSKAVQVFEDQPEKIGGCFIQSVNEFDMYVSYCKNRPRSEVLVDDSTENHAFFKGIQRNLGHPLDLNSYLLKPVQRITKYQLLLKDLIKCCSKAAKCALEDLETAHSKMIKILQNLNDSMHAAGLKDLPEDLPEQGKLLAHDPFLVSSSDNPGRTSRFPKGKDRHVFLFDKMIILSRKSELPEDKKGNRKDVYLYKEHLDLSEVTLRETESALQFSLSLHGKHKEYLFDAQSKEVQSMWVTEVRRLLQVQFTHIKMEIEKTMTIPRNKQPAALINQRIQTVLEGPSRHRRVSSDVSKDMSQFEEPQVEIRGRANAIAKDKSAHIRKSMELAAMPRPDSDPGIQSSALSLNDLTSSTNVSLTKSLPTSSNNDSMSNNLPTPPTNNSPTCLPASEDISSSIAVSPIVAREPQPYETVQRCSVGRANHQIKYPTLPKKPDFLKGNNLQSQWHDNIEKTLRKGDLLVDPTVTEAIQDVQSETSKTRWCACGYRGNNHKQLIVYGCGEDYVDGLKQHLKNDNIVFALMKVMEAVDCMKRRKLVYIQWMGESCRPMAKAKTTTSKGLLESIFKPYSAAIFATSLLEISERTIMTSITESKNCVM